MGVYEGSSLLALLVLVVVVVVVVVVVAGVLGLVEVAILLLVWSSVSSSGWWG